MIRRVTNKPWFGPKKYVGWGWRITRWQGAVVLLFFVGLLIIDLVYAHNPVTGIAGILVISGLFVIVCLLTGDPPGGADIES